VLPLMVLLLTVSMANSGLPIAKMPPPGEPLLPVMVLFVTVVTPFWV